MNAALSRLRRRSARLFRLPLRRWVGMIRVVLLATYVEFGLARRKLPELARSLGVDLSASEVDVVPTGALVLSKRELERIDDVRRVISRRPFNGTCLRQSLLVGHALKSRRPALQLGVRKINGGIGAHAWIVVDGQPIDDYRFADAREAGFVVLAIDVGEL